MLKSAKPAHTSAGAYWEVAGYKGRPAPSGSDWRSINSKVLQKIGLTGKEAATVKCISVDSASTWILV